VCGLAGYLGWAAAPTDVRATLEAMGRAIAHRGPDDHGVWMDADATIGLSHRRLAILDLSQSGHQPMSSASGRLVIAFNGEIYNHRALRKELEGAGVSFRGHSDTEVLLEGCERWGIHETLRRTNGMFAIALWDAHERALFLARDRVGEKPLYYAATARRVVFGSELRALRAHPAFDASIDAGALANFVRLSYVPAPRTIYSAARKLSPGACIRFRLRGDALEMEEFRYWQLENAVRVGLARRADSGDAEAHLDEMEALLSEAVALRMEADVPLGAFLSGGIDSSLVVALMQKQSVRRVRTFTIGFDDPGFDESKHAEAVARHLGTEHLTHVLTAQEALRAVPELGAIYDEPFADASQLPTLLLSRVTRGHVTVALSGDGGDEVFGGYNRYVTAGSVLAVSARIPGMLRGPLARVLRDVSPGSWDRLLRHVPALPSQAGEKLHKLAGAIQARSVGQYYEHVASRFSNPLELINSDGEPAWPGNSAWMREASPADELIYLDMMRYLPDDILVKVDRATMSVGLEGRIPLLDHRVVECAWALPSSAKIRGLEGKWLLRRLLERHLPRSLFDRPKAGFAVPVASWLRGPLREWADGLLSTEALGRDPLLNATAIRALWREFQEGRSSNHDVLWNLLMYRSWREAG